MKYVFSLNSTCIHQKSSQFYFFHMRGKNSLGRKSVKWQQWCWTWGSQYFFLLSNSFKIWCYYLISDQSFLTQLWTVSNEIKWWHLTCRIGFLRSINPFRCSIWWNELNLVYNLIFWLNNWNTFVLKRLFN